MPEAPDPRIEANRRLWDARVPLHVASEFYDDAGFRAGRDTLEPFEADELGPVAGRELLHLQCHFGQDTLSWARRGARVTGLDISEAAVAAASALAADLGLDARFVVADVYDAVEALAGRRFDIVYTGLGALNWLPDLDRWAAVVARLLRPGGRFYLLEFHPITDVFSYDDLDIVSDYWTDPAGVRDDHGESYVGGTTEATEGWEWNHPLGDVVTALLGQGLRLDLLHEHPHTVYRRWPFLEEHEPGRFRMPADRPRLPLLYSLRATLPEG